MTAVNRSAGRLKLLAVAAVFFLPLALATWMYRTGQLQPGARTNNGALILPAVSLADRLPATPVLDIAAGQWVMLYANAGACGVDCRDALFRLRQVRLMLGSDMGRVSRVFLHAVSTADRVFVETEHAGLEIVTDPALDALLEQERPEALQAGGIYLIDPLGNLIMYFSPDITPRDMVDDLKHLLDLSRIG